MPEVRNAEDGRVHFSDLSAFAQSARHYVLSCTRRREVTRPMVVGSIGDDLIFHNGRHVACYPGKVRNGKEWESFKAANTGTILCILSELEDARGAADAVKADPIAQSILAGCEFQRVMQWDAYGLPCAAGITGQRGGFDALNVDKGYVADLKIVTNAEPEWLKRHAYKMHWDAQLAWYIDGAQSLGMRNVTQGYLVCAEAQDPHCVTVLHASPDILTDGRKKLGKWTEDLRGCEASGVWPPYTQSIVAWERPEWVEEEVA